MKRTLEQSVGISSVGVWKRERVGSFLLSPLCLAFDGGVFPQCLLISNEFACSSSGVFALLRPVLCARRHNISLRPIWPWIGTLKLAKNHTTQLLADVSPKPVRKILLDQIIHVMEVRHRGGLPNSLAGAARSCSVTIGFSAHRARMVANGF